MPIIRLEKLLKPSTGSALGRIIQSAQHMDELTTLLKQELQPDLAANLLAASLRENGELVLIASSSAWASRFRFETESLMKIAQRSGATISSCRVAVSKRSGT